MVKNIVPECSCIECGNRLDVARQEDGKGSFYWLVTCWQKTCGLFSVTRSLETYVTLTPAEIDKYREMNRLRDEVCNG